MSVDFSDTKTIDDIYYSKILPKLKPFEQNRLAMNRFAGVSFIILFIVAITAFFIVFTLKEKMDSDSFVTFGVFSFVLPLSLWIMINSKIQDKFKQDFKAKIYPLFINVFGMRHRLGTTGDIDFFRECFKRTGIFERFDNITVDDIIQGNYKNLDYQLLEARISYEKPRGKSSETVIVFNGTCLVIPSNKPFTSMTVVRSDMSFFNPTNINDLIQVKLEDVEFEKIFEVYSNDQVEARYLLTTAFMSRLVDYTKEKESSVYVIFNSGYIYLFINYADKYMNLFEFNLGKTLYDKETLTTILQDINNILNVVDGLKLEQDLGL